MSHRYCSASHDGSWISWFLSLPMNEFLCRVPVDYIQDRFNLTGLDAQLGSQLSDALDLVLESEFDTECFQQVETDLDAAAKLYGLIHARYILTARGIDDMCMKYQRGDFGKCPRLYCHSQLMLPVGVSDRFGESHVKLYCARCRDIYQPQAHCAMLDGANFGRSFPHMFFMQLTELLPSPPKEQYTPRIYGFQVHATALMPPERATCSSCSSSSTTTGKALGVRRSKAATKVRPSSGEAIKQRSPMRRFSFTLNQ